MTLAELQILGGCALGALYFAGLWLVVRAVVRRQAPRLLSVSQVIRVPLVSMGLMLVGWGTASGTALAVLGLIAARLGVSSVVGRSRHAG